MERPKAIRIRNWLYELFVIIEALFIIAISCLFIKPLTYGLMVGAGSYLVLANVLRSIFLKHHRRGIKLMNSHQFDRAIEAFSLSFQFFAKNEWIDKYQFITMFMSSKVLYRQMALYNMAVCYASINQMDKARKYLDDFLETSAANELTQEALVLNAKIEEARKNKA